MPIRKELRKFYRTPEWYAAREAVKSRAKDCCENCGAPNRQTVLRAYEWWTPATLQATVFMLNGTIAGEPVTLLPWHHKDTIQLAHFPRHDGMKWSGIQCGCAHVNGIAGDDRIDENLRWWCRGCHLRHDIPIHVANAHETRGARKDEKRPLLAIGGAA